ncbi:coth protein-domain-containing protein [Cokeromyces recurvatus]|uniref:coth protein-domain-containing protein n=1 Tax=Cokeromyces recurvatus TaxID=90255 RepID=UPI002220EEC5|nr:coth protein-domain-containing protein [Cokeromyces recurvatus]KAI7902376.1 coth protein-domain-containing protein [Cokeromyces recurvatus]
MYYKMINIHFLYICFIVLGLFTFANAQSDTIRYNVISLINETHSMGVVIDNITYPLMPHHSGIPILHSGEAPIAKSGYSYVKITKEENNNTEVEPFMRSPSTKDTVNEFFKRSWNKRPLTQLPTLYKPLDDIHRIYSQLHIDDEIPTIHLIASQNDIDKLHTSNSTEDIEVTANMTYVTLNDTLVFQNTTLSLSGRSSRWMPKLSYNIKLDKKDRLYDYRRLKLRALYTDPSYIREKMAYDVIKSVGLLSSELSYVRVMINHHEIGLFGLIDTFKDPWLANVFANGNEDYKNGYLYQGVFMSPTSGLTNHTSDLAYYDNITEYSDGQYKIKVEPSDGEGGEVKDAYEPLMAFTKFIKDAPTNTSDAVTEWRKHLNTESFLRSMALEVILGYSDGYLSMADNYYLYQNPDRNNFFYISSDMDLTLGSTMFKLDWMWSGNYSTFPGMGTRPLMNKILQVPEFKQRYEELLVDIAKNLVNPVVMNSRINDIVNMLEEDVEWDRRLPRVGKDVFSEMVNNNISSEVTAVIGNEIPSNFDLDTMLDFLFNSNETISFKDAVNGPTGRKSLSGVKEWIHNISKNILSFYNLNTGNTSVF